MHRDQVQRLYYITSIGNLASILDHGILSYARAARLLHSDIAMASVQDVRSRKRVPQGKRLHEYACLYLWARNPMLFKRSREMLEELCVLSVDPSVLELEGVVIADSNAAADIAHFAPYPDGLSAVDAELTFAEFWTAADPIEQERRKKRMCAEVLVPDRVAPDYIRGAYLPDEQGTARVRAAGAACPMHVWKHLFFR